MDPCAEGKTPNHIGPGKLHLTLRSERAGTTQKISFSELARRVVELPRQIPREQVDHDNL